MSAASIIITQEGVAGAAGVSRDDLVLSEVVTLRNANDNGVRSWRWRMKDRPTGSSAVLSNPTAAQVTFTPDEPGTYLIELKVDAGLAGQIDTRIAAVREEINGEDVRWIAAGEDAEANWDGNTRGWLPDLELLIQALSGGSSTHAASHLPGGADALTTAAAVELTDSTNAEGAAASFARSNHTHSHGSRGGGSLHASVVASGAAGFMIGADKAKLDGLGATNAAVVGATDNWVVVRDFDFSAVADTDFAAGGDTTYALNDGNGALTFTSASTANANGGSDTNGGRFRKNAADVGADGGSGLRIFHDPSVNTALNTTTNTAPRLTIPLSSFDPAYDETLEYRLEVHVTRFADSSAGSIPGSFFAAMFLRQLAGTPAGSVVRQVGVGLDRSAANNGQGTVVARNGNRAPVSAYDFSGGYNVLALQFGPHQIAQAMLGIYSGGWPATAAMRIIGTTSDTMANAAVAAAVNMRDNLVTLSAVATTNGTGSVDVMYRRVRLLRRVR